MEKSLVSHALGPDASGRQWSISLRAALLTLGMAALTSAAHPQALVDLMATPSKPLSPYAKANMLTWTNAAASWAPSLKNAMVDDLFRMAQAPNRRDLQKLIGMARVAMKDDAQGLQSLQQLSLAFRRFEAVFAGSPDAAEKYDLMMDHRDQLSTGVDYAARNLYEQRTAIPNIAKRVHTEVGAEALKVRDVWYDLLSQEKDKARKGVPGAAEAQIVLSSTTVDAALYNLELARRRAIINDPAWTLIGAMMIFDAAMKPCPMVRVNERGYQATDKEIQTEYTQEKCVDYVR